MDDLPPLRQQAWYIPLWIVLLLASGAWTTYCGYLGWQITMNPPAGDEQGFGGLQDEARLWFSIPIYLLFIVLLFSFPKRRKKTR